MTEAHQYSGTVEHGSKRAAALGYPTINIKLEDSVSGVYAAKVYADGKEYRAAAFADPSRKLLEAHLIDFSGDLYGRDATIELHEKLRDSKTFTDDDSLKAAIDDDVAKVREYFKN
jgi:riboflavin kinase/FMN adenylyltransferase